MEEIDKSKQLDEDLIHQDKEIEKLETFINSPNGLNQEKVDELQHEVDVQDETITHLLEVIGMNQYYFISIISLLSLQKQR